MGSLNKLISRTDKSVSNFLSATLPELLRLAVLLSCIAWKSYKLLSTRYNYTSTIGAKSSKFRYSPETAPHLHGGCSVCLSEFEEGEEVRQLAECGHAFHRSCLEKWLIEYKATCPLCRSTVVPPGVVAEFQKTQEEDEEDRWIEEELAVILLRPLDRRGCNGAF